MKPVKMYILDYGRSAADMNLFVLGYVTALANDKEKVTQWHPIPIQGVLLIMDDGTKVLYDCGVHREAMNGHLRESTCLLSPFDSPEENSVTSQLKLCGVTPEEIDTLIISHMHIDHIGELGLFTKCPEVIASEKEFMHALRMVHWTTNVDNQGFYNKEEVDTPIEEYHLINGDYDFCENVQILSLPGHSDDILGLKVEMPNSGKWVFMSDAAYLLENYGPPAKLSLGFSDSVAYFKSIEKVRLIEKNEGAKVIVGHDIDQFNSLKHAPDYYD